MSRVVSFRCSEELDQYLEEEAKKRLTTKSTVAQMLVAERARELGGMGGESGEEAKLSGEEDYGEEPNVDGKTTGSKGEEEGVLPELFRKYEEKWKRLDDAKHDYRVTRQDGSYRYYRTVEGAEKRLKQEYEIDDGRQVV